MREKHGGYDQEQVLYESPSKLNRLRRGRPKVPKPSTHLQEARNKHAFEELCLELDLEQLTRHEAELDLLLNEHIKVALSALMEFGAPTNTRKQNLFFADYDEAAGPLQQANTGGLDLARVWPDLPPVQKTGPSRLVRF